MKNALVRGGNIDEVIRKHGAIPTVKNEENVVFMFSAEWCPDCRFVDPFMPEVEEKYSDFSFYYVIAMSLSIMCKIRRIWHSELCSVQ